jgi:hypothetical protein
VPPFNSKQQAEEDSETVMTDLYRIQVLNKNGEAQHHLTEKFFYIENIRKGGFRFFSDEKFELEDRVQVQLRFPDERTQQVLGRICYSEKIDSDKTAYVFSVIEGFYSLLKSNG